jgi:hypothetical protein
MSQPLQLTAASKVDTSKNKAKASAAAISKTHDAVLAADGTGASAAVDSFKKGLKKYQGDETAYASSIRTLEKATKTAKGADPPEAVGAAVTATDAAKKKAQASAAALVKAADSVSSSAADASKLKGAQDSFKAASAKYQEEGGAYVTSLEAEEKAAKAWAADLSATKTAEKKAPAQPKEAPAAPVAGAAIANAVTLIVQTIVWQSFTTEKCQRLLFLERASRPAVDARVTDFCLDHMKMADQVRAIQLLGLVPGQVPVPMNQRGRPTHGIPDSPIQPFANREISGEQAELLKQFRLGIETASKDKLRGS